MLTIGELKEAIKDLPDDMEVGGVGHFGEILECYWVDVRQDNPAYKDKKPPKKFFALDIEWAGEEPD